MSEMTTRACGDRQFDKGCVECQKHEVKGLKELLGGLVDENKEIAEVLEGLVERLDYIHASSEYQAVWSMYQNHVATGPVGYEGPTYEAELDAARSALRKHKEMDAGD